MCVTPRVLKGPRYEFEEIILRKWENVITSIDCRPKNEYQNNCKTGYLSFIYCILHAYGSSSWHSLQWLILRLEANYDSYSIVWEKTSQLIINWLYAEFVGFGQRNHQGKWIWIMSVTSYLGPDNIWPGNATGFARKRDGYTFIGDVVVRTGVDLRGHCWRSRSWNAAVRLACSMSTGFSQAALSAPEAFLHYKPMMKPNLACHYTPLNTVAFSSGHAANEPPHCNYSRRVKSPAYCCFPCWVSTLSTRL